MWDDLNVLDKDFDIEKENKLHLKHLRKMRSEYPHIPESLTKKISSMGKAFYGRSRGY